MRYVIAVAAPIGGGKTALVNAVAGRFDDATTIHFDHYEKLSEEPEQFLMKWMKNGADFNDFSVPGLPTDLDKLKRGEPVIDPLTGREITSKKYIIFEMPLGKEHRETAEYIDLLIWIEIPLDIALARKIKEFTNTFLKKFRREIHRDSIVWLNKYLDNYLNVVREVLQIQREKIGGNADIIIDGRKDFETMVQLATQEIREKLP